MRYHHLPLTLLGLIAAILLGGSFGYIAGVWIWLEEITTITWVLALGVCLGTGLIIGGAGVWVAGAKIRQDVQGIPEKVTARLSSLDREVGVLNAQLDQVEELLELTHGLIADAAMTNRHCPCCDSTHPGLSHDPWNPAHHQPMLGMDAEQNDCEFDCPVTLSPRILRGNKIASQGILDELVLPI